MRLKGLLQASGRALVLIAALGLPWTALAATDGDGSGDEAPDSKPAVNAIYGSVADPAAGATQSKPSGIGGFADRVKTRDTNIPERDGKTLINVGTPYVNAIFGGLGQGAGFAGGIEFTTADAIDGVELYVDFIGSIRKYREFEAGVLVGDERNIGEARYVYTRRIQDNFFGLGPDSTIESFIDPATGLLIGGETNYDFERRRFSAGYSHVFTKDFVAGVYVDFASTSVYVGDDDEDPSIFALYRPYLAGPEFLAPLSRAEFANQVPGLGTGSKVLSFGVFGEFDARNYDNGLTEGGYVYARFATHDGTEEVQAFTGTGFGNEYDYGWTQVTLDARGYLPVFSRKTSLAARIFADIQDPKGGSVIPFYDLARLGGNRDLRGFDTFRFHGENALVFQAELRQTVYTQDDDRGADVIFFGDVGQVWGLGFEPPFPGTLPELTRAQKYDTDNYEADVGFGVSYRVSKQFAVRFDYAHSNEDDKVRFIFSRGF